MMDALFLWYASPDAYFTHRVTPFNMLHETVYCYRCKPEVKILINALKVRSKGGGRGGR